MEINKTDHNKKGIAILGSTGSIGQQALDVISSHSDYFQLAIITAHSNSALLIEQAKIYKPQMVFIAQQHKTQEVIKALKGFDIRVLASEQELFAAFYKDDLHMVLMAMVGFAGLRPTLAAIEAGKDIALANKECLVVAGELVMKKVAEKQVNLIPVDSEHSAIFQCIRGEVHSSIEKVILTASGGPFFNYSEDEMRSICLEEALQHPTWNMGQKITIDSASMMNKGLEVIEARWLFNLKPEQIDVIAHPQSAIHSLVMFRDGSIKAQMSPPDMRGPIHYALFFPHRFPSSLTRFNFLDYPSLSFNPIDMKKFRNLALAFKALKKGGNQAAILNAANEAAVEAVLQKRLPFYRISEVVEEMMNYIAFIDQPSLADLEYTHQQTIIKSKELISRKI